MANDDKDLGSWVKLLKPGLGVRDQENKRTINVFYKTIRSHRLSH